MSWIPDHDMQSEFPRSPLYSTNQPWTAHYQLPYCCAPFPHTRFSEDLNYPTNLPWGCMEEGTRNSSGTHAPFTAPQSAFEDMSFAKYDTARAPPVTQSGILKRQSASNAVSMEEQAKATAALPSGRSGYSNFVSRRGRTVFTTGQLCELEKVFTLTQYIAGAQRKSMARQLGLSETQVRVWFQNRRIKWRKKVLGPESKA